VSHLLLIVFLQVESLVVSHGQRPQFCWGRKPTIPGLNS
jgi:hypothetical protein